MSVAYRRCLDSLGVRAQASRRLRRNLLAEENLLGLQDTVWLEHRSERRGEVAGLPHPRRRNLGTWSAGYRGRDKVFNGTQVSSGTAMRRVCRSVWEGNWRPGNQGEGWYKGPGGLRLGEWRTAYSSENISG